MSIQVASILVVALALSGQSLANQCPDAIEFQAEYDFCVVKIAGPNGKYESNFNLWIEHGMCIVKCMMEKFKVLTPDGRVSLEAASQLSKDCKEKHTEYADKIDRMETCFVKHAEGVDPAKPDCSGYHNLVTCLYNEFKRTV